MRVRRTTDTVGGSLRAATHEASSIAEKPSPAILAADVEHQSFVMDDALFVRPDGIRLSQRFDGRRVDLRAAQRLHVRTNSGD